MDQSTVSADGGGLYLKWYMPLGLTGISTEIKDLFWTK